MAEKRYKKYKFIKKQIAFNQNRMSLDTVEESIIMPNNSKTINDPVISDQNPQFDLQITNNRNNTNYITDDTFRNFKLITFLKTWSLENKINHT
ncbi:hypothetical protein WN55_04958 [Dufourea novaeangliae]|uniref:Uncharacterized protein n=1 Tax=Dufourea novaeangliae TaxID=178035 RepID=A0A154PNJ0_DUFNO|nr:hypothetical protein WN55_04958 [Dufourea novaeangliae]